MTERESETTPPREPHPSHEPLPPQDISMGRGLVYCKRCGFLLWSERGPSQGSKAYEECRPAKIGLRDDDDDDDDEGAR